MKKTQPTSASFSINDVFNAARHMQGVACLTPQLSNELRRLVHAYWSLLRDYSKACRDGTTMKRRATLFRLMRAPSARITCTILAYPKRGPRIGLCQAKLLASRVNPRKASKEHVVGHITAKKWGGERSYIADGPVARAGQKMTDHIIFASAGHSDFDHARRGHGREKAIAELLAATREKGARWFAIADVKNFFPSITREMVQQTLPHIPWSVIKNTVFIPAHRTIKGKTTNSVQAIRQGLPQGSLASPIVAAKVLEPHLEATRARKVVAYVDDLVIAARTKAEAETKLITLRSSLEEQPHGSLHLKSAIFELSNPKMDYLGYRFLRRGRQLGDFSCARPSRRSFERLYERCALRMFLNHWTVWDHVIEVECDRWVRSFPMWSRHRTCAELTALNIVEDVDPLVWQIKKAFRAANKRWKSFAEMGTDLNELALRIAEKTPPLFCKS